MEMLCNKFNAIFKSRNLIAANRYLTAQRGNLEYLVKWENYGEKNRITRLYVETISIIILFEFSFQTKDDFNEHKLNFFSNRIDCDWYRCRKGNGMKICFINRCNFIEWLKIDVRWSVCLCNFHFNCIDFHSFTYSVTSYSVQRARAYPAHTQTRFGLVTGR